MDRRVALPCGIGLGSHRALGGKQFLVEFGVCGPGRLGRRLSSQQVCGDIAGLHRGRHDITHALAKPIPDIPQPVGVADGQIVSDGFGDLSKIVAELRDLSPAFDNRQADGIASQMRRRNRQVARNHSRQRRLAHRPRGPLQLLNGSRHRLLGLPNRRFALLLGRGQSGHRFGGRGLGGRSFGGRRPWSDNRGRLRNASYRHFGWPFSRCGWLLSRRCLRKQHVAHSLAADRIKGGQCFFRA